MANVTVSSKVHGLCKIIDSNNTVFLCSVRVSKDRTLISLSDGVQAWTHTIAECKAAAAESDHLRSLFVDGECSTSISDDKATITLRSKSKDKLICYDLSMLGVAEAKAETSTLLFLMAQKSVDLEKQLEQANTKIESLQRTAAHSSAHNSVFEMSDNKKKKPAQKALVKQAGMSVLNPGSRKRTKAQGVEFD